MNFFLNTTKILVFSLFIVSASVFIVNTLPASAAPKQAQAAPVKTHGVCGSGKDLAVKTSIDIGCKGKGNPIVDAAFAIIRLLSNLAGLVIVASLTWAGIQYTLTRGDPQAVAAAQNRIKSSLFALLLFIFAYAILNYLVPGQFLQ